MILNIIVSLPCVNWLTVEQRDLEKLTITALSLISLGLFFGPSALSILSAGISASTSAGSRITAISSALSGVCTLAAIVLMIVARVKYPKNKLAKVVMWIYIALFAIGIIGSVLLILACAYACRNC